MAIVPDQSPTSAPTEADFGANDWLLEEMYEQYAADPTSVDETWAEYFKTHGAPITETGNGSATETRQPQREQAAKPRAEGAAATATRAAPAPAPAQASQTTTARPKPEGQAASKRTPTVEKGPLIKRPGRALRARAAAFRLIRHTLMIGPASPSNSQSRPLCVGLRHARRRTWTSRCRCRPRPAFDPFPSNCSSTNA